MPPRRKAVTPEEYDALLRDYCAAYGVAANADGSVAFPAGRRETPQHRAWVRLYKARQRLARQGPQGRLKIE